MKEAGIAREATHDLASSMYRSLGSSVVEALWFAAHPDVPASSVTTLDEWSRARLDAAREDGRGAVIATAHAGNWEIAAAALAEEGALTAVVKPMHVGWVERFCRESRGARGITSLRAGVREGEVMSAARAALRRGETVAMMIDQVPDRARHACEGEFLSRAVDIDRSPAVLAARVGVPLIVAVARRVGLSRQRLEVLAVLDPPRRGRMEWAVVATRTANSLLERWVHAHPSEWLWMHRRWRRVTSGAREPPRRLGPSPQPPAFPRQPP